MEKKFPFIGKVYVLGFLFLLNQNTLWSQDVSCGDGTEGEFMSCKTWIENLKLSPQGSSLYGTAFSKCLMPIGNAMQSCQNGKKQLQATLASFTSAATGAPVNADVGGTAGSMTSGGAGTQFTSCASQVKGVAAVCYNVGATVCGNLATTLANTCEQNALAANEKVLQGQQVAKAAGWLKPALIGAAAGVVGSMLFMGRKKGGGGGGTPSTEAKKDEPEKLPGLVDNKPAPSTSTEPNITYIEKPTTDNGSALGRPATLEPITSSGSNAVTVASATPSSDFASAQNSPSTNSDPNGLNRTPSSSGSAALSGGSGNLNNMNASESTNSGGSPDSTKGSLVDSSGKGSGGSTPGGIDALSGSGGSGGLGNSADGTFIGGALQGIENKDSKKALVQKNNPSVNTARPLSQSSKRKVASFGRKPIPVKSENLLQSFQRRGLVTTPSKQK